MKVKIEVKTCGCGCHGQDPWHRSFTRELHDIVTVIPTIGEDYTRAIIATAWVNHPSGRMEVAEVGYRKGEAFIARKWMPLSQIEF